MNEKEIAADEKKQNKDAIIAHIAKTLLERRQSRSLSLEKVSAATKIRPQLLAALEKGNWHEIAAEVYVRGFIIRYAQYMGINGLELLKPYLELEKSPSYTMAHESEKDKSSQRPDLTWIFVGVGALVLIGIIKLVMTESTKHSSTPKAQQTTAANNIVIPSSSTTAVPVRGTPKRKLQVYTNSSLWLRVNSSNKNFEGFITEHSTWTWEGEGALTLRLGHTKGVSITVDGRPISLSENQKKIVLPNEN
jgi:transcriptional regulator with XRE-family HTH domain